MSYSSVDSHEPATTPTIKHQPRKPKCLARNCCEQATHRVQFAGRGLWMVYCEHHAHQYARVNDHTDNIIRPYTG